MFVLNSCCCFSTKTGATIIAILDIVGGIIVFGTSIILFAVAVSSSPEDIQQIISRSFSYQRNTHGYDTKLISNDGDGGGSPETYRIVMFVVAGVIMVLGSFSLVFGSILLYGIRKESTSSMQVWIIVKGILLVFGIVITIAEIVIAFSALELFQNIVGLSIAFWLIVIVHSHWHKVQNGGTTAGIVYSKPYGSA